MAQLAAQAAACAEGVVNLHFSAHHADGRTAELHAGFAAYAFFGLCLNGAGVLDVFEQGTRTAGDNNRRFICGKFLFDRFVAGSKIIRINDLHTPDANGNTGYSMDSPDGAFNYRVRTPWHVLASAAYVAEVL